MSKPRADLLIDCHDALVSALHGLAHEAARPFLDAIEETGGASAATPLSNVEMHVLRELLRLTIVATQINDCRSEGVIVEHYRSIIHNECPEAFRRWDLAWGDGARPGSGGGGSLPEPPGST